MKFEIQKIQLKDLEAFGKSSFYNSCDTLPISLNRIASYVNNPRADKNDVVLYMAMHNGKLVGFRTVFADAIFVENKPIKFGWCSGTWVKSEYRRKGISMLLLENAYVDWNNNLLLSNYAPEAKLLIDKSTKFNLLKTKRGTRFYFSFQLEELLIPRNAFFKRIRLALKLTDSLVNFILYPLLKLNTLRLAKWLNSTILEDSLGEKQSAYLLKNNNSIFKRSEQEYKWIFKHPWITDKKNEKGDYPFSTTAKEFYYKFLSIESQDKKIFGLCILKIKEGKVTTPYFYAEKGFEKKLALAVISFCFREKVSFFTSYNKHFITALKNTKLLALFRKNMTQKYFITKKLELSILLDSDSIEINDGDGDSIFT